MRTFPSVQTIPGMPRGTTPRVAILTCLTALALTLSGCGGGGGGGSAGGGTGQLRSRDLTPANVNDATVLLGKLQRGERTYASLNDDERALLSAVAALANENKAKRSKR